MRKVVFVFTIILIFINHNLWADTVIEKNGYRLAIDWHESSNDIRVWGMIKDGKLCKKLNVNIYMKNEKGGTANIRDNINYFTKYGVGFEGRDKIYKYKRKFRNNNDWYVDRVYIDCKK